MSDCISCGFSKLPIEEGDKVVFIPLKEWKFKFDTNNDITPATLVYPTDDFVPFTFPIVGEFDFANGIINIEKDKHTEIIEETYNMSIEQFVHVAYCDRSFNDSLSALFDVFADNKDTFEKFFKNKEEEIIDFGFEFHEGEDAYFKHPKLPSVYFEIHDKHFIKAIELSPTRQKFVCTKDLKHLLNAIQKHFSIELNVKEELIPTYKELNKLSGMFVLKEVFDKYILNRPQHVEFFEKAWVELCEGLEKRNELKQVIVNKGLYDKAKVTDMVIDSFITNTDLSSEFKFFDNISIYYDYLTDDSLKSYFQDQLTTISFMNAVNISYYPSVMSAYAQSIMLEFEEFKVNWLKEKLSE